VSISITEDFHHGLLELGHLCIAIWDKSRVVGYIWEDCDKVNDTVCDFALGEREAHLYDAFVAPEFRGKRIAPHMRYESYQILRDAGFRTFFSISEYFNTPAIDFKMKLNAEIVRLYLEIKLGGRRLGHWILKDYVNDLQGRGR
jgi:ribosomal protein S18 acetylase RimI-like enzyme